MFFFGDKFVYKTPRTALRTASSAILLNEILVRKKDARTTRRAIQESLLTGLKPGNYWKAQRPAFPAGTTWPKQRTRRCTPPSQADLARWSRATAGGQEKVLLRGSPNLGYAGMRMFRCRDPDEGGSGEEEGRDGS